MAQGRGREGYLAPLLPGCAQPASDGIWVILCHLQSGQEALEAVLQPDKQPGQSHLQGPCHIDPERMFARTRIVVMEIAITAVKVLSLTLAVSHSPAQMTPHVSMWARWFSKTF